MVLTDRQRGLLTLLLEKMNWHGEMMGATENRNWVSQVYYEHSPESEHPQGTLDRIGKVTYSRCFHADESPTSIFPREHLDTDPFDHSIRLEWRELFGKGWGPNPPESMLKPHCLLLQDKVGNWHSQKDLGFCVHLWHPSSQVGGIGGGSECVHGKWLRPRGKLAPHWRPVYDYTSDEVKGALKIMAGEFGWEYGEAGDGGWMILRHAEEE